ncbi:ABC transporter ATP-binding protein [Dactylosporangium aurantiacum]|uniref:ABC transporter ATP-binding protein n=1 Tax=Dactylosporangium aurantiacum TaxID=35754 RepID=A0A9Q9IT93_9ACTN|nr:ABC transporter ATP-binding protein [Dactylosporangium aurantiacum]MDG6103723.1 ABC transporter ATP-binding protein [Dactylosporangium aurantiacum]UWZ59059.1 ABC transporter ATP-binding protein [Dactylosporangium aurantiacum]
MNPAIRTAALTKRYRRRLALHDCTVTVPAGRIVGLVGPNGAGKSTLLGLVCGMITPTSGSIEVLGHRPAAGAAQLSRVGFVAQDAPVYSRLTVAEHLRLGARLNPNWDDDLAQRRIRRRGLDPDQKAGALSGGQRAQLALTVAAAKRGDLLVLDEPVAALDPLARRAFLDDLLDFVDELAVGVVLSSHLLGDLEQVCDHLIVLAGGRVQLAGDVADLLAEHHRVTGAPDPDRLPAGARLIHAEQTRHETSMIVRCAGPVPGGTPVGLEGMTLAYLTAATPTPTGAPR